jgi:hypothetical protein
VIDTTDREKRSVLTELDPSDLLRPQQEGSHDREGTLEGLEIIAMLRFVVEPLLAFGLEVDVCIQGYSLIGRG